jgi:hypothetical protein
MALICTEITEWIRENVSKPVEDWEQRRKKKCKERAWYDPRGWFCWFITYFVKITRWIVVTVLRAVVSVVCRLTAVIIGIIVDLLQTVYLLLKALFTWDKCVLQEAIAELGNAVGGALTSFGTVIIGPLVDAINQYRLRGYVSDEIERRFADRPRLIEDLKRELHIDSGVFGYRLTCKVWRLFVDSQTRNEQGQFNLSALHDAGLINLQDERRVNLYELAGFQDGGNTCAVFSGDGWYRPRPQTATFPFATGGGFGEPTPPPLERESLDEYVESHGQKGPHFRIFSMTAGNLEKRMDAAQEKGRQLGIIMSTPEQEPIEVTEAQHIYYSPSVQASFFIERFGRRDEFLDADAARLDLCSPIAVGVFRFVGRSRRGETENLTGTTACAAHNLFDSNTSGVSFIDDIPDELRKYVLIHELGHYFGLCHVDGFARIMVSGKEGQGKAFTWGSTPSILFLGGPRFTHGEAKQVWDYILDNFPVACLLGASQPPEGPFL